MIIDAFTHIYPQPYFNLVAGLNLSLPVFFQQTPTDFPYVPVGPTLQSILEWDIPESDKSKILSQSARKLFKLG